MKIFLLIGVVFATFSAQSQSPKYEPFQYYEGYIVKNDGTEERGYVQYLDEADRYQKVIFKTGHKEKKQKFKVGDIAGYMVAGTEYKGMQYDDVIFKQRKFLIVDERGCISTYHFREFDDDDRTWKTITVFENAEGAVNSQKFALSFAKSMGEFVKDNPGLAEKVRNKEKGYGMLKMYDIIDEYNADCQTEKQDR